MPFMPVTVASLAADAGSPAFIISSRSTTEKITNTIKNILAVLTAFGLIAHKQKPA